jgi:hypothetical protein
MARALSRLGGVSSFGTCAPNLTHGSAPAAMIGRRIRSAQRAPSQLQPGLESVLCSRPRSTSTNVVPRELDFVGSRARSPEWRGCSSYTLAMGAAGVLLVQGHSRMVCGIGARVRRAASQLRRCSDDASLVVAARAPRGGVWRPLQADRKSGVVPEGWSAEAAFVSFAPGAGLVPCFRRGGTASRCGMQPFDIRVGPLFLRHSQVRDAPNELEGGRWGSAAGARRPSGPRHLAVGRHHPTFPTGARAESRAFARRTDGHGVQESALVLRPKSLFKRGVVGTTSERGRPLAALPSCVLPRRVRRSYCRSSA